MPIPADLWKELIKGALERLSDADYQRRAWFNRHEEQTSPDEQICQILDDYLFEEFIHSSEIGLPLQQQQSAMALVVELRKFGGASRVPLNPYKVIGNPEWEAIRVESEKVLVVLFRI